MRKGLHGSRSRGRSIGGGDACKRVVKHEIPSEAVVSQDENEIPSSSQPPSKPASSSASFSFPAFASSLYPPLDPDMAFSRSLRDNGLFMFVTNLHDFGHLLDADQYDTSALHPDLRQLLVNQRDWERKYLHPEYQQALHPDVPVQQPCPDVYWFPLFTPAFCDDLVQEMEQFGRWSSGKNQVTSSSCSCF